MLLSEIQQRVYSVRLSPNRLWYATATEDAVKLWHWQGKLLQILPETQYSTNVEWSKTGQWLLASTLHGELKLWKWTELEDQPQPTIEFKQHENFKKAHKHIITSISWLDNSRFATCSRDTHVKIWSTDGNMLRCIESYSLSVGFPACLVWKDTYVLEGFNDEHAITYNLFEETPPKVRPNIAALVTQNEKNQTVSLKKFDTEFIYPGGRKNLNHIKPNIWSIQYFAFDKKLILGTERGVILEDTMDVKEKLEHTVLLGLLDNNGTWPEFLKGHKLYDPRIFLYIASYVMPVDMGQLSPFSAENLAKESDITINASDESGAADGSGVTEENSSTQNSGHGCCIM